MKSMSNLMFCLDINYEDILFCEMDFWKLCFFFYSGSDESKTNLILNSFFMKIVRPNAQFKCKIMENLLKFVFCRNLEKRT